MKILDLHLKMLIETGIGHGGGITGSRRGVAHGWVRDCFVLHVDEDRFSCSCVDEELVPPPSPAALWRRSRSRKGPERWTQGMVKAHTEGILSVGDADRDSVNREAMVNGEALCGVGGEEEHERA
jgi:hypothetical protein